MTPPKRLTKERKQEIRKALDQGNAWESDLRVCLSEIDALEAENEDLKVINEVLTNHSAKLESKLRSRIAKLREGLGEIHQCGLRGHKAGTSTAHSFELGQAAGIAFRLIAQDDEEEKT